MLRIVDKEPVHRKVPKLQRTELLFLLTAATTHVLRTMKATKPELRPRRRWSSSRGHMIFTLAMGPYRPNSCM